MSALEAARNAPHYREEPSLPAERSVEPVHDAGGGRRFDRAAIQRAKHVALFLRSSRKSKHVLLDGWFRAGGPLPWMERRSRLTSAQIDEVFRSLVLPTVHAVLG